MINIEDELFSDNQTDYSFSELIEELERNGEILRMFESGEIDPPLLGEDDDKESY